MTDMAWHAPPELVGAYLDGSLQGSGAASFEAHVVNCRECQRSLAARAEPATDRLDNVWAAVTAKLDAPQPRLVERALRRIGISETDARLIITTPALHTSWLAALAAILLVSPLRYQATGRAAAFFLISAPVFPLAAVAVAFSRRLDPIGELSVATPLSGLHLVLVRGVAALTPAAAVLITVAIALPGIEGGAAAWLLPSAALCACSLAMSTWIEPVHAAAGLATTWVVIVSAALVRAHDGVTSAAAQQLIEGDSQLVLAAITVAAGAVVVARRQAFEFGR